MATAYHNGALASSSNGSILKGGKKSPASPSGWYGATTNALGASSWDEATRSKVASRLLVTLVVCGLLGSFLPVLVARPGGLASDSTALLSGDTPGQAAGSAHQHAATSTGAVGASERVSDGTQSLIGGPLKSCSTPAQSTQTGWTRDGSCAWDPSDSGYHEVCVKMDEKFLASSAEKDGNDLSSVVGHGEHWCICAWAWAGAVQRDPEGYEGLTLQCDESNEMLREVYQSYITRAESMSGPTGASYGPLKALEAVDKLCPAA
uniref:Uncharacterized protein n=1 Tax=Mantoniella antarctica TaxID=81844 RepID=A0A7S0SZT9_9CHLO|mmetsp:Transcript_38592/g.95850  ORF Transcript_38592/g.95850 Transcript_38592/m.95850 type:complete len:263 (+) Transcript_38592:59-847(+)|eukprot:CAMPEP_0181363104 /NCGR_PEP_ID=MMETSP1106-20121128/8491_1 /TAXON_ID=81844 /ORGANISM="Mantoniella antarctica, Strain SL-175" /LENGTH=262 /DNA_ID=CAMNT_0023477361 /DNA_START=56 /DNA_END=844 /DNA_ORIENTATION=+